MSSFDLLKAVSSMYSKTKTLETDKKTVKSNSQNLFFFLIIESI